MDKDLPIMAADEDPPEDFDGFTVSDEDFKKLQDAGVIKGVNPFNPMLGSLMGGLGLGREEKPTQIPKSLKKLRKKRNRLNKLAKKSRKKNRR